jgi:hypothetical protein
MKVEGVPVSLVVSEELVIRHGAIQWDDPYFVRFVRRRWASLRSEGSAFITTMNGGSFSCEPSLWSLSIEYDAETAPGSSRG